MLPAEMRCGGMVILGRPLCSSISGKSEAKVTMFSWLTAVAAAVHACTMAQMMVMSVILVVCGCKVGVLESAVVSCACCVVLWVDVVRHCWKE